ncbi:AMP-binding protein [Kordia sp.]|uniref:AMP-binding protein n=1 Tax=Kordia sp. TaxID=1965332 RepID=UPI003D27F524
MEVKIKKYANLFEIYRSNLLNNPKSTYIVHKKSQYTYADCNHIIDRITTYLQCNARKNELVVGLNFSDQFKFIVSFWACTKLEATIILIQQPNAHSKISELENLNMEMDVMLSDDNFETIHEDKIDFITPSKEIHSNTYIENSERLGYIYFYTSGTTGKSKFVKTTYYQIVHAINCIQDEELMPYAKHQNVLITVPLFHSYGLSCLVEYTAGNSKIVLPPTKDFITPIQCLFDKSISEHISAIEGVPYFYQQMALLLRRMQLPCLQHIGMGGDTVSQKLVDKFHAKNDSVTFSIRYGITEIPSVIGIRYFTYSTDCKPSKLGKIPSIYNITIEKDQEDATIGELSIVHPFLPNEKKKIQTGDLFEHLGNEFNFISRKTFLKYKGYKINPIEVETHVLAHPEIDDCKVLLSNRILTAEIVTNDQTITLGRLKEFLKPRLTGFMIPDTIEIVESIKRTKTGKIIRH